MIPSKEKLTEYLEILQCVMRIQDWDVETQYLTGLEMRNLCENDGCLMYCETDRNHKWAKISINKEEESNENPEKFYKSFCHELFHVVCDDLAWSIAHIKLYCPEDVRNNIGGMSTTYIERLVNNLAKIFVSVYPLESLCEEESDETENTTT